MLNRLLKLLIISSLALLNAEVITEERDENASHEMMFGSKPSTIPTGGLVHDFQPMDKNLFLDVDISENPEAHLFAGYGVFDQKDDNCVYVDIDVDDGSSADLKFMKFKIFNGHSYAESINEMTYAECAGITAKYNGYPVRITTGQENDAVAGYFALEDKWIGAQRDGPCPSKYVDYKGNKLLFNGYASDSEICSDIEPLSFMPKSKSTWEKTGTAKVAKCIVEFESENWEKPLKTCAPWWGIERTYMLPTKSKYLVTVKDRDGNYVEVDIRDFNQKDFPATFEVCSKVDVNSTATDINAAPEVLGTREVYCNSYYSRTASPRCMDNPNQSLCEVDECRGAIKDMCLLVDSGDAPLTYSKEPFFENGTYSEIKGKVNIQVHKYRCPIIKESAECLETQSVIVLPQPCPGTDVDSNGTEQRALRTYGNPSRGGPNKYSPDGTLQNIYGECPDGQIVEIPVNVLKQSNSTCLKYETVINKEEYDQMCVVDREPSNYIVEAAITAPDVYREDDSCVRINNIEDARPRQDIRIDYETYGMANLAIVKATIDAENETKYQTLVPSTYYQKMIADMSYQETSLNLEALSSVNLDNSGLDTSTIPSTSCSAWDEGKVDAYMNKLLSFQINAVKHVHDYDVGEIVDLGVIEKSACVDAHIAMGSSILFGESNTTIATQKDVEFETAYNLGTTAGIKAIDMTKSTDLGATVGRCVGVLEGAVAAGDLYKQVDIASVGGEETPPDFTFSTAMAMNYSDCRDIAVCTAMDILNTNKYVGNETCRLHLTDSSGQAAVDELQGEIDTEVERQVNEMKGDTLIGGDAELASGSETGVLALDQIDGFTDIYAIIEYTDFTFGYASSYSFRNFKSNSVKVNGLFVQPLAEHSRIIENPREDYTWDYTTYRNSKPNPEAIIAGGIGGGAGIIAGAAAVGAASTVAVTGGAYAATGALSALGVIIPWGLVLAILVAALVALFMTPINLITFEGENTAEVYNVLSAEYRYVENPYGYESRLLYDKNGQNRVKYAEYYYKSSGKIKKSHQSKHFAVVQEQKNIFYKELNININGFVFPPHESTLPVGDPGSCKWYNPWCKKSNSGTGAGTLDTSKYHTRPLTVHYMGATNTATIIVPYKGSYAVDGYNQYGELVASGIASETSFINTDNKGNLSMAYAQIKMGEDMSLSPNLNGDACVDDLMVEVGGGVSGAYYELGKTGKYNNFTCSKSDNAFVMANSITQLKVRPLDQKSSFTVDLPKPLPYVNRVFIATFSIDEDRKYRCFGLFPECSTGFNNLDNDEEE